MHDRQGIVREHLMCRLWHGMQEASGRLRFLVGPTFALSRCTSIVARSVVPETISKAYDNAVGALMQKSMCLDKGRGRWLARTCKSE
jgi:hypothetical protein